MIFFKKIYQPITIIIFLFFLFFSHTQITLATAFWGDGTTGALVKQNLELAHEQVYGFMLASLKTVAAKAILENVGSEISGTSSSDALFITDWKDELFLKPSQQTQVIMNDFFTNTTRGRASSIDYKTLRTNPYLPEERVDNTTQEVVGIHNGVSSGNYLKQLVQGARSYIFDPIQTHPDIQEYINGDITNMFANGSWRPFMAFISNDANNPFGYTLNAQRVAMNIQSQLATEAQIRAIAYQGYKSKNKDGSVITPGINIKDLQSKAQGVSFDILSNATYIQEVVASLVTRITSSIVKDGIGHAHQNIQKEDTNSFGNYANSINTQIEDSQHSPNTLFSPIY